MNKIESKHFCFYCGKPATHQFKNGKWCCENNVSKCSKVRQINREKPKGIKDERSAPLCKCGCKESVGRSKMHPGRWNQYIYGHHTRGDNNPMRRPEIAAKFVGDNNPMRRPEVLAKKSGENHHFYGKRRVEMMGNQYAKGQKYSEERRKTISERLLSLGDNHPSKRPEFRERMRSQKYAKGHKHTEEWKKATSERMKCLGENHWMKTSEHKERVREFLAEIRPDMSGPNHPQWKGGIATEPYCGVWLDKEYKQDIFERDDHRCQNPNCWRASDKICRHHIDYDKKNCHPKNIITVCISCNSRANSSRKQWQTFYQNVMTEKHGYNYSYMEAS